MTIRTLICDDQALVRDGLEMMLKLDREIEVVGTARDGAEALEMVESTQPDLVLMDLKMPGMNGIEATRQLHARFPNIKVLVLTTFDDDEWVFDALRAGAAGYLLKDSAREEMIKAVKGTVQGRTYVDPGVAGKLVQQVSSAQTRPPSQITGRLTGRELDVLRLLARGLSNADIAGQLHLSEGTVRNHISALLAKLEAADRTQAAVIAIRHGLDQD